MGYLEIPNSWTCKLSLQIADTKKPHQSEAYAAITPLSPHEHNYQRRAINIKFSPKLSRTKHYVNLKFSGDKYWHSNKKKYHFSHTLTDIAGMINSSLYIFKRSLFPVCLPCGSPVLFVLIQQIRKIFYALNRLICSFDYFSNKKAPPKRGWLLLRYFNPHVITIQ